MRYDPERPAGLEPEEQARLLGAVMRRQIALSLRVAGIFILLLIGLPLLNFYRPDIANRPTQGFTLSWLFLGILFYPITWILSVYFVRQSDRIEAEMSDPETLRRLVGENAARRAASIAEEGGPGR